MSKENEGITAIVERVASDKVTAKLWLAMPAIEQKLSEGVEHKKMVEALREGGLDVSLDTFRNLLYRYRRKHGRVKKRRPKDIEKLKTPAKVYAKKPEPETPETENSGGIVIKDAVSLTSDGEASGYERTGKSSAQKNRQK